MKTIQEWFEGVADPNLKSKLLANLQQGYNYANDNTKVDSYFIAICQGFIWANTPEGFDYWNNIAKALIAKEVAAL